LHLVGILFPHINDDARSKSHQTIIVVVTVLLLLLLVVVVVVVVVVRVRVINPETIVCKEGGHEGSLTATKGTFRS